MLKYYDAYSTTGVDISWYRSRNVIHSITGALFGSAKLVPDISFWKLSYARTVYDSMKIHVHTF